MLAIAVSYNTQLKGQLYITNISNLNKYNNL